MSITNWPVDDGPRKKLLAKGPAALPDAELLAIHLRTGVTGRSAVDNPLRSLQAASCTYRIAFGPRAGQKVLSLRTVPGRDEKYTAALCAEAHGFSLHAGVRCGAHQRKELERLCRYITRPVIANERLKRNRAGQVVLQLKSAYRDGTTHIVTSPLEFMQRHAAGIFCVLTLSLSLLPRGARPRTTSRLRWR
jgi:Putative transposase